MTGPGPLDPHLDEDLALEVVHGLRSDEEIAAAVEHARGCPACERLIRVTAGERERLRARADRVLGTATASVRKAAARRPGALASVLAAAAVVAVVTSVVLLRRPAPPRPANLLTLPAPLEMVHLRTPDEADDLPRLEQAIERYGRREWRQAAALLDAPFKTPRLDPMRRLYRASALLELGRPDEARALLDPVAHTRLPEPYAAWRDWARLRASADPADAARADSIARERLSIPQ